MPFCRKCGAQLAGDDDFCVSCGTPRVRGNSEAEARDLPADPTIRRGAPSYAALNLEDLPAGHAIDDRYEIKRKLGQGGFGAVYLAHDRKMETDKALKVIPESVVNDEEAMENLRQEARTMINLNHPNIVRVYDFHDTGPVKYIDMEYVDGQSLTRLKLGKPEKKLSEEDAGGYALQIAEGLAYAHSRRVIHKDIKPQNVLVASDGTVKIADFGIAETVRTSMSRIAHTSSSGTLVYMSPEQIRGQEVGRESDVYSFGAMLYDLLSGHPPFWRGAVEHQILSETPGRVEGISEQMSALLDKCLAKDYRERFGGFEQIVSLLRDDAKAKPGAEPLTELELFRRGSGHDRADAEGSRHETEQRQRVETVGRRSVPRPALMALAVLVVVLSLTVGALALLRSGKGSLAVQVSPPQAEILVDGSSKGRGEYLGKLSKGSHEIIVSAQGFESATSHVNVPRDSTVRVRLVLRELPGSIQVTSDPADAGITLGGKEYGRTPKRIDGLRPGEYIIKLSREGYSDYVGKVVVTGAEVVKVGRTLGKATTALMIETTPPGATVTVNGRKHAETTPLLLEDINPGRYGLLVHKDGYRSVRKKVVATRGKVTKVALALKKGFGAMVRIPAGSFMMGSTDGDSNERPAHKVTLSGFYMDKTEVTQKQYERVMGRNPSGFKGCPRCPVERVRWHDAKAYCAKVGKRLPTEAEWEYAARAGTTTKYYWGNGMDGGYAWYSRNSGGKTHPVGTKKPNAWGLYDMSGNVLEWCSDRYGSYRGGAQTDPEGAYSGKYRVVHGGSWNSNATFLRSAYRDGDGPDGRDNVNGFRCAVSRR